MTPQTTPHWGQAKQATNAAMDKLRDEMAANATHPGVQQIGAYMTARLAAQPEIAPQLLAEGKTLTGAFEAIHTYASKNRTGNYACVPPETAYKLVAEYYGIPPRAAEENQETQAPAQARQAARADGLDLDTLLGGL